MRNIFPIFLLISCLFLIQAKGQLISLEKIKNMHPPDSYIGANVGASTGVGFSYRSWYDKNGGQITFMPIYNEVFNYSFGISYLREIRKADDKPRILAYIGIHNTDFLSNKETTIAGAGLGFEEMNDNLCLSIMFGLGGYVTYYETKATPLLEVGLFYYFSKTK